MGVKWIEETSSTNSYVRENLPSVGELNLVVARRQTAGRGQRGNRWESEPGKNLTFSYCLRPRLLPSQHFRISEAAALAVTAALADYGIEAKVKWPNDIYVGERKICGILIENSIMGAMVTRSIVGTGLNVNQMEFVSDAPNPVSMAQLTGRKYDLDEVAGRLAEKVRDYMGRVGTDGDGLQKEYLEKMWRNDGEWHTFRDVATRQEFRGKVEGIDPGGLLKLRIEADGTVRRYAFKEIEWSKDDSSTQKIC